MKPMKKLIFLVLTLCLAAALCPALTVPALAADTDGFVIEGTTLKQYTGPGGSVTIPDGVTEISASAFKGNTTVTSVTIPDSVTTIMSESFKDCTSLTKVVLPKKLKYVPDSCFKNCTALTEVNFPEGPTTLGDYSFQGCTSLRKVVLPDGITSLNSYCFEGCTSLTDVTLPEQLTALPYACFQGCTSLERVVLPESIKTLGGLCFRNCAGLKEVTLPKQLTSIEQWCFMGCASLQALDLPDGLTTLGSSCFSGCTSLKTMVIPNGITELGNDCFWKCTSLESVVLPEGIKTIGAECFNGCTSLSGISLPNTVTELGDSAFVGTTMLTSIDLPEGLKTIGKDCFQQSGVKELTIPASVTKMGRLAEIQAYNPVKTITFKGTNLSALSADIYSNVTVYVQPGTVIPDWLKNNIVHETNESTPTYRLDISGVKDGRLEPEKPFEITNGVAKAQPVTVKNTGTKTLSGLKFQSSTPNLQVSMLNDVTSIEPNKSGSLKLLPQGDLKSGKYTAAVTVTADGEYKYTFNVDFTVTASTCLSVTPTALDFGTAMAGYDQPGAKPVTIRNTGNHEVTLQTGQMTNFTCTVGKTQLAVNESTTVTIQPKAGLAVGEYKETIRFTCSQHSGSFTVDLQFTVKGEPKLASTPTEMDFGKAKQGYTPEEMSVDIKNTGTATLVLKTAKLSSPNFEFRLKLGDEGYERGPGQSAELRVRPVSGLKEGTYTGTLDIDTDVGVKLSIPLKFVVEGVSSISVSPDILNFGSVEENYTQPAAKTVTIKNTGKSSVTLQTPTSTNYVLGPLSRTTLAAGAEATFTVQPKAGLKKGVYTEWIVIKTAQNDSASFGIDFQVQEKKKGSSFVDVKEGDWFYEDVEYVYEKGLMNGVGNDRFNPGGITSRGQIVTILYRLDGEPAVSGRSSFPDVGSGQYYTNAVKWASDHQIVSGYSNGNFGPDDPITREQMAAILYRYASYKKYNVSAQTNLSKFKDAKSISDYALNALAWANSRGLITGVNDGTTIKPQGNASRAEAAAILHRFSENIV